MTFIWYLLLDQQKFVQISIYTISGQIQRCHSLWLDSIAESKCTALVRVQHKLNGQIVGNISRFRWMYENNTGKHIKA